MLLGALVAAGAPADWLRGLPARLGCAGRDRRDRPRWSAAACGPPRSTWSCRAARGSTPPSRSTSPRQTHVTMSTTPRLTGMPTTTHAPRPAPPHRRADRRRRAGAALAPGCASARSAPSGCWARPRGAFTACRRTQVALHEVGAVDALVDIVGAHRGVRAARHRPDLQSTRGRRQRLGAGGARRDPGARAGHSAPARGHRDRPQRPRLRRGGDADRRGAAPGALGGRAAGALAGRGGRRLGCGRARSVGLSQRAPADRGAAGAPRPATWWCSRPTWTI